MNAKATLFSRVLLELKAASAYFTTAAIARRARELGLEIKETTFPVYLTEATASGLIHDAGRGWYSRLSERVPLDTKPVAKLIRAVEKILVDIIAEAPRLALMDATEAQGVATGVLNRFLVQIAVLQRYADSRAVKIAEVEAINQRQSAASIGVS